MAFIKTSFPPGNQYFFQLEDQEQAITLTSTAIKLNLISCNCFLVAVPKRFVITLLNCSIVSALSMVFKKKFFERWDNSFWKSVEYFILGTIWDNMSDGWVLRFRISIRLIFVRMV